MIGDPTCPIYGKDVETTLHVHALFGRKRVEKQSLLGVSFHPFVTMILLIRFKTVFTIL